MMTLPNEEVIPFSLNASRIHLVASLERRQAIRSFLEDIWAGRVSVSTVVLEACGPELDACQSTIDQNSRLLGLRILPPGADAPLPPGEH